MHRTSDPKITPPSLTSVRPTPLSNQRGMPSGRRQQSGHPQRGGEPYPRLHARCWTDETVNQFLSYRIAPCITPTNTTTLKYPNWRLTRRAAPTSGVDPRLGAGPCRTPDRRMRRSTACHSAPHVYWCPFPSGKRRSRRL